MSLLVRIENIADPDQKQSKEAVLSGPAMFVKAFFVGSWCFGF